MPKRRFAHTWYRVPLLVTVALLLSFAGYRAYRRWNPVLSGAGRRPTPQQAAGRLCVQILSRSTPAFTVKRLPDRTRAGLMVIDSRRQPLVLTNLELSRLASVCGLRPLAAREDRRRGRLSLVFGTGNDSLVWVEIQRKQRSEVVLPSRPLLALAAYGLPPENCRAWQALLRRTTVKTLITDQPLRTAAREVLVALPLEPIGYPKQDPGPGTLLLDDNDLQLRTKLTRFSKYAPRPVGFAANQGSRALKDQRLATAVMRFCADGGLLFLEPRFTANSLAREAARACGCRYLTATVYIEQKASAKGAAAALASALARARRDRTALVLFPVRDDILAALDRLLTKQVLAEFDLVGVSALLER